MSNFNDFEYTQESTPEEPFNNKRKSMLKIKALVCA